MVNINESGLSGGPARRQEAEPTVMIRFELPGKPGSPNTTKTFKVPLGPDNTFLSPSAILHKVVDTGELQGSHMFYNGTFMSITDSNQMKAGDTIRVQLASADKVPSFKLPEERV